MTICKNCGHEFEGNYCSQCRQSAVTERLTLKEIFRQLQQATVDVDRGYFYTIREMVLRPGITLRNYIEGKRVNLSNPFFFVLLSAGFASLLFMTYDVGLLTQAINLERIEKLSPLMAQKHFVLVGTFFITMLSLSDWALYRWSGLNFAELLVANAYQAGQILVVTVLFFPLLLLQDRYMDAPSLLSDVRLMLKVLMLFYLAWVRYQFFGSGKQVATVLVAILQLVTLILLYEFVIAGAFMRWAAG